MRTNDDIKYCMTDRVPNEILIRANLKNKVQPPSCLTDQERYEELLERYKEE